MLGKRADVDQIFPTFTAKATLNSTQAAAIFVTEFDIVPAMSGWAYRPILFHVNKEAGAYGIAAVTAIQLVFGTVANNNPFHGIAPSGFLDSASDLTYVNVLKGNGLSADFGVYNVSAVVNTKLALRTTGAALSGAGGNLNITVFYTIFPAKFFYPSV